MPKTTYPAIWFQYRTNPAISSWDTAEITARLSEFPFIVSFAYTLDETNHMADILLPDRTDLEGLQLTLYMEPNWRPASKIALGPNEIYCPGMEEDGNADGLADNCAEGTHVLWSYDIADPIRLTIPQLPDHLEWRFQKA